MLFKLGRVTGYTDAMYANIKTCQIATHIIDGEEGFLHSWEHAFTVRSDFPFVEEGDLGSLLVTLPICEVRGIIFGGSQNRDIGYFTSTQDLLEDIKHIMGLKDIKDIRLKPPLVSIFD